MMQAATQATLVTLVEQHITSLVRECAVINRHSKRRGFVSAGDGDGNGGGGDIRNTTTGGVNGDGREVEVVQQHPQQHRRSGSGGNSNNKKRLLIHHDDVNLALAWRGSEKLYVSGVPLLVVPPQQPQQQQGGVGASSSTVTDDDDETDANNGDGKRKRRKVNNSPLRDLLRATTTS